MSSSTVSHDQAMKDQIESMEANLKCPVCLIIPRKLPIPCCTNGHIVCRSCRKHVTSCPTCRQPMPENMINSVVGALIDQTIKHKCKYSDQGCEVKLMLKDLKAHERKCPDKLSANQNILQLVDVLEEWQKKQKLAILLEEISDGQAAKILVFVETNRRADGLTR